jgi:pimeloyl-ACP methyl ester carboxylesterase
MKPQLRDSQERSLGCLGVTVRLIGVLLLLLAVSAVGGAIYEAQAQAAVAANFPAPGQLVTVNGRTMHIQCVGAGSPTLILDAGQGGWSNDWADLMPVLSQDNQVCAYDRAGYGWSERAEGDRSPLDAANDLASLLSIAQIEPPYVLVGFSHAGLAGRIFAAQYADQVAGMVLVDPATEFDNELMSAALMQQQQAAIPMFKGFGFLARFGVLRLIGTQTMAGSAPFIPTDVANPDLYYAFIAAPQWWETSAQEFTSHLDDDHLAMVHQLGPIPDIPLIIIASDWLDTTGNPAMDGLQAKRHEVLRSLVAQTARGEFIIAEKSTHNVLSDRPDVVLDAIKRMLAPLR